MVSKPIIASLEFERGKVHCYVPILLNRIILTNNQKEKMIEGKYISQLRWIQGDGISMCNIKLMVVIHNFFVFEKNDSTFFKQLKC